VRTVEYVGSAAHTARAVIAVLSAAPLLLLPGAVADAAEGSGSTDERPFVLSGSVDVSAGETVRDVVVLHGVVTVDGVVLRVLAFVPFLEGLLWFPGAAAGLGALGAAAWNGRRASSAITPPTVPTAGATA
jgi:hypothetical protein